MRAFQSLSPVGLHEAFDATVHGEEPIVSVEESKGRIVISYVFPGFYFVDQGQEVDGEQLAFKGVDISKIGVLAESGKPLLPSFGRYVQIPFNCDYKVTVQTGEPLYFHDVLIFPAQQQLTDSPDQKSEFEFEKEFYASDQWYPENIVHVDGPYEIDGYNALVVHVRPAQYNPALKQLRAYGNIEVKIDVVPKKGEKDKLTPDDADLTKEAFGNLFLNPRRGVQDRLEIDSGLMRPLEEKCEPDFLIIYYRDFKDASEKLALWKNMIGLRTEIVAIEETGGTVETIKTYVRNRRKAQCSRLRYVLLFGDVDMIPSEVIPESGGRLGGDNNVSDYYYSTPRDPESGKDLVMPWLSIGRIPVRTAQQAAAVVDKILGYEGNPPGDPEYYRRMTFAGYFQDWNMDGTDDRNYMKTLEAIRQQMIVLGFDVQRVYVSDNPEPQRYRDGTPVPPDVKMAIVGNPQATDMLVLAANDGQLIMAHRDHGMEEGWHRPEFTNAQLASIGGKNPSMFFSVNCLTGRFDLAGGKQCFAEELLAMNVGAPSLIAATRASGTWLNDALMMALFDGLWAGVLPTFPGTTVSYPVYANRLGDVLNYGKSYLLVSMSGDTTGIKDHFEIYHVVGDPTLCSWTEEPKTTTVNAVLSDQSLNVTLSDCPTGAVMTIWLEDKMLKRLEPSSTQFKMFLREIMVPMAAVNPRAMFVCFAAPRHRPVKRYVTVA